MTLSVKLATLVSSAWPLLPKAATVMFRPRALTSVDVLPSTRAPPTVKVTLPALACSCSMDKLPTVLKVMPASPRSTVASAMVMAAPLLKLMAPSTAVKPVCAPSLTGSPMVPLACTRFTLMAAVVPRLTSPKLAANMPGLPTAADKSGTLISTTLALVPQAAAFTRKALATTLSVVSPAVCASEIRPLASKLTWLAVTTLKLMSPTAAKRALPVAVTVASAAMLKLPLVADRSTVLLVTRSVPAPRLKPRPAKPLRFTALRSALMFTAPAACSSTEPPAVKAAPKLRSWLVRLPACKTTAPVALLLVATVRVVALATPVVATVLTLKFCKPPTMKESTSRTKTPPPAAVKPTCVASLSMTRLAEPMEVPAISS